jgi:hypothetical protein
MIHNSFNGRPVPWKNPTFTRQHREKQWTCSRAPSGIRIHGRNLSAVEGSKHIKIRGLFYSPFLTAANLSTYLRFEYFSCNNADTGKSNVYEIFRRSFIDSSPSFSKMNAFKSFSVLRLSFNLFPNHPTIYLPWEYSLSERNLMILSSYNL